MTLGAPQPLFAGPRGPARVLVMDDEASALNAGLNVLRWLGCDVTGATDGREALLRFLEARVEERPFDAVVLDVSVPAGMGGEATLKRLREIDPRVRAIFAGHFESGPHEERNLEFGVASVLAKPFDVVGVVRALIEAGVPRADAPVAA